MPPAYTRNMRQTATYWAPSGNTAQGGAAFAAPVTISCRWQDKIEMVRDADGNEFRAAHVVYAASALAERGYLALGDETATADPTAVAGAREIRATANSPDLPAKRVLNKVWL